MWAIELVFYLIKLSWINNRLESFMSQKFSYWYSKMPILWYCYIFQYNSTYIKLIFIVRSTIMGFLAVFSHPLLHKRTSAGWLSRLGQLNWKSAHTGKSDKLPTTAITYSCGFPLFTHFTYLGAFHLSYL